MSHTEGKRSMGDGRETSPETLRRASDAMSLETTGDYLGCTMHAVADWLWEQASDWDRCYAATTAPSLGIDEPAGVYADDPDAAAKEADHHASHALRIASVYLRGSL